jgi:uncharacterized phiE125 gp8 family phage protein
MFLERVTVPAGLPVSVAEAKAHTRIDYDAEDGLVETHIRAAAEEVEQITGRALLCGRYRATWDDSDSLGFCRSIAFPRGPIRSVLSVERQTSAGEWEACDPADYLVKQSAPARLKPVNGWPVTFGVRVTFDAGDVTTFTTDVETGQIALDHWPEMAVGDMVFLTNSGGALATPLPGYRPLYIAEVVDAAAGVYTLAESPGGAAVTLTAAGSGVDFLGQPGPANASGMIPPGVRQYLLIRAADLYEHRNSSAHVRGQMQGLGFVPRLLDASVIPSF